MPANWLDEEDDAPERNAAVQSTLEAQTRAVTRQPQGNQHRGAPWFEEMVRDSPIGRIKRQKGGHTSQDGRTTVEWEVVEVGGDDDGDVAVQDGSTQGKRNSSGEVPMRSI